MSELKRKELTEAILQEEKIELKERLAPRWPDPLDEAGYYGLAGEFVKLIAPHSEADPVALLDNFLTAFGNVVGNEPNFQIEATKHKLKLFSVQVGETAKGRKGTAMDQVRKLFSYLDEKWSENIVTGSSSGEGLINAVRDRVVKKGKDGLEETVDEGVEDKRLLLIEAEFASMLKVMGREGNTLSPIVRSAWDRGDLRTLTRNFPLKATNTHISIIGHITTPELLRYLNGTEMSNGFGNRFLWLCVKRSKELAFGGAVPFTELNKLQEKVRAALRFAEKVNTISFDDETRELWIKIYHDLTAEVPGLVGSMSARIEPYTLRLAGIYALIDQTDRIRKEHLKAAVAVIDYAMQSLKYIFKDAVGDPLGNDILFALNTHPDGMTKSDINNYFSHNKSSEAISSALENLVKLNRVTQTEKPTTGRPTTLFTFNSFNTYPVEEESYLQKLNIYLSYKVGLALDSTKQARKVAAHAYVKNEINEISTTKKTKLTLEELTAKTKQTDTITVDNWNRKALEEYETANESRKAELNPIIELLEVELAKRLETEAVDTFTEKD